MNYLGSDKLIDELRNNLDQKVRVLRAPCMGLCDKAPACEIGHNHLKISLLDKVKEVIKE